MLQLTTFNMLLKAFAVSLIILSVYFLGIILQRLTRSSSQHYQNQSYHIGCYDSEINLNESKIIQQYLLNLSQETAPFSVSEMKKFQLKVGSPKVKTDVANTLALQFKKYITAYQNIKNLNQYQQSYNRGLRQARDSFLKCREGFVQKDWDCKGSYSRYLQTDQEFTLIKSNLSVLIQQKYTQQQKIQKLLELEQGSNEEDYENYRIKIESIDKELLRFQRLVKEKNETFIGLENKEFKLKYDLNFSISQNDECEKNKKEIQTCKFIIERLKEAFSGFDLNDFQNRVDNKRKILQKYNNALVKSNKLGLDTSQIKSQITKNTLQLNELLKLYSQTQVLSMCSGEFIKKCSDEQIAQLKRNITSMQQSLEVLRILKNEIKIAIQNGQSMISQIIELKGKTTGDYQNTLGSIDKIKETQVINQRKLLEYKQNINKINVDIAGIKRKISEADENRRQAISELDIIIGRVGSLSQCLSKKEYLIKLQSKKPQRKEDNQKLKRQTAQALIKILRSAYK